MIGPQVPYQGGAGDESAAPKDRGDGVTIYIEEKKKSSRAVTPQGQRQTSQVRKRRERQRGIKNYPMQKPKIKKRRKFPEEGSKTGVLVAGGGYRGGKKRGRR